MQSQVQRPHPSQTDVISSALQTMSFPKSDAEYEKDLKLAFTFESEMLNDTQSSKYNLTSFRLAFPLNLIFYKCNFR